MSSVHAIYENGVFRPLSPVKLPEHCEVEFEPKVVQEPSLVPDSAETNSKSALDAIKGLQGKRLFASSAEVDKYLAEERNSWER